MKGEQCGILCQRSPAMPTIACSLGCMEEDAVHFGADLSLAPIRMLESHAGRFNFAGHPEHLRRDAQPLLPGHCPDDGDLLRAGFLVKQPARSGNGVMRRFCRRNRIDGILVGISGTHAATLVARQLTVNSRVNGVIGARRTGRLFFSLREVVRVDAFHFVGSGCRDSDAVVDHQFRQFIAINQHDLAVAKAGGVIDCFLREI